MTEKLTPEEIIEYLNKCNDREASVVVVWKVTEQKPYIVTVGDVIDLINRQQAEIDNLKAERNVMFEDLQFRTNQVIEQQAEIEEWKKINQRLYDEMEERRKEDIGIAKGYARIEAIKEFAERLKKMSVIFGDVPGWRDVTTNEMDIDNLVKEMVGEQNV